MANFKNRLVMGVHRQKRFLQSIIKKQKLLNVNLSTIKLEWEQKYAN